MFALAQAPPDHAHRLRTQRNRHTSFCGRRSRCGADLIAAVGDRCPVDATADRSRAGDGRCCIPASGPLAGPRGRRCSSVEGAYPNAGGAVPLGDPLAAHPWCHDQRQREQNWSIGRADHGLELVSGSVPIRRSGRPCMEVAFSVRSLYVRARAVARGLAAAGPSRRACDSRR